MNKQKDASQMKKNFKIKAQNGTEGDTVKKKANLQECEKHGLEIDRLTIKKDYEGLEKYIKPLKRR